MKFLKDYKIFEKSIGVDNIYTNYYSDIKHESFSIFIRESHIV